MENLSDILMVTIPALLVFFTAWILLRNMIRNEQERRRQEIVLQGARTVVPIKLQAYERIVLFLERISMESLLVRVSTPDMTATQLHSALLTTIRNEFEHNLSQQIYMSSQAWEVVKNARSNTIKTINSESEKLPAGATGIDLSRHLLERVMDLEKEPTKVAIDFIKSEIAKMI
jgi:MFS superfamily sulfate permease-like transporter